MSDPQRLLDDPELGAELRADLEAVRSHAEPFDVAAGLTRFQTALGTEATATAHAAAPPSAQGASSSTGSGAAAAKIGAGKLTALAVASFGGALALWGLSPEPSQEPSAPPPALVESAPPSQDASADPKAEVKVPATPRDDTTDAAEDLVERASPPPPIEEAPAAPAETRPQAPPVKPAATAAEPEVEEVATISPPEAHSDAGQDAPSDTSDALQREVKQLGEIRKALGSDPARALALANAGHREFADGRLYQEREALALRALRQLGRRAELERRGQRFIDKFPESPHATLVRSMLTP